MTRYEFIEEFEKKNAELLTTKKKLEAKHQRLVPLAALSEQNLEFLEEKFEAKCKVWAQKEKELTPITDAQKEAFRKKYNRYTTAAAITAGGVGAATAIINAIVSQDPNASLYSGLILIGTAAATGILATGLLQHLACKYVTHTYRKHYDIDHQNLNDIMEVQLAKNRNADILVEIQNKIKKIDTEMSLNRSAITKIKYPEEYMKQTQTK